MIADVMTGPPFSEVTKVTSSSERIRNILLTPSDQRTHADLKEAADLLSV
jgi:hypothetical protein